jgi:hypothetical protein
MPPGTYLIVKSVEGSGRGKKKSEEFSQNLAAARFWKSTKCLMAVSGPAEIRTQHLLNTHRNVTVVAISPNGVV